MEVGQVQNFGIAWRWVLVLTGRNGRMLGSGGWLQRGIIPNLDEERGQGQHSKIYAHYAPHMKSSEFQVFQMFPVMWW